MAAAYGPKITEGYVPNVEPGSCCPESYITRQWIAKARLAAAFCRMDTAQRVW